MFLEDNVSYLGYTNTQEGASPVADKVSAILDASASLDVPHLESFLGSLNFYCRFTLGKPSAYILAAGR